jgi:pilus assembly protein CpaB
MSRNRKITLLLSVLLSLLSTLLIWQKIRKEELKDQENRKTARIVVAGKNIHKGDILNAETLQVLEFSEKGYFPRMLKESDYPSIEGAMSKHSIKRGNPLNWDDIENPLELSRYSFSIDRGKRALSIHADENLTFSGLLRPGDHVDIYLTQPSENDAGNKTILLLENVQVSAIDANFTEIEKENNEEFSPSTVTLIVNRIQAASLLNTILDTSKKLGFVLRNPDDKAIMMRKGRKKPVAHRIEIFKMGKLTEKFSVTRR